MHLIDDHTQRAGIPLRFAATKLVEGDQLVEQALSLDANEQKAVEHIVSQMETESGQDRMAALADMRFSFISDVCSRCVVKIHESREHARSVAIDRILTGRHTAIPAFVLIMGFVFWLTFSVIGQRLSDLLAVGVDTFTDFCDQALTHFGTNEVIHSLVINGVFAGVGTVISFLPIIVTLFLLLSLLEDSGYMARIAFVMDKALRKVGLSGRSIVPMLVGFGCTVPAVMATRTLPSEHDRKMTVMLTPFMSCSAKLPIYTLLCAMFFPQHAAVAMICLYLLGILVGIVVAKILQQTTFHGQPVPFVMELPNYRFPSLKTTARLAWDKTKGFLTRAFSIIFIASITVWFLQTFDVRINMVADQSQSMLATLGSLVTPIFTPLGFSDWRASTALITGLLAKESVVSTLTVLLGGQMSILTTMFTPFSAFVFLTFTLLYPPCVAAISSVRAELGGKWALAVFAQQLIIAWVVAWIVHLIGVALGFS
jgi:ferrous iron transport protein B